MASDTSLFTPELCFFDWECDSWEEMFQQLGAVLLERGNINAGWFEGIATRERNYPTGLQFETCGVAIPHTDPEFIEKPYIAIVKPKKPITFAPMAGMGDPVQAEIAINLGILRDGGQVEALSNLVTIFMDEAKAADVLSQTTGEGMIATITKYFE